MPEVAANTTEHGDVRDMIARPLAMVLRGAWPAAGELAIADLRRTSTGLSRENWVFEAQWREADHKQSQGMILRRDPPASLLLTDRRAWHRLLPFLHWDNHAMLDLLREAHSSADAALATLATGAVPKHKS